MSNETEQSDIAELLAARLRQVGPLTTLVANRIRPDVIAQGETLPAVRYKTVADTSWYTLEGAAGEASTRVQFDAYGATRREANLVAHLINQALSGLAGVTLGEGDDVVEISDCVRDNKFDAIDPPPAGSDQYRRRRVQDYVVVHTEPVPSLTIDE